MIITPNIRMNVSFTTHPHGIVEYINEQATFLKEQPTFAGPKNALIIGGSTGYGLASKLALGLCAHSDIVTVSYEAAPASARTGSAGFWNTIFSHQVLEAADCQVADFIGDAFADETKAQVAEYIRTNFGKLEFLVYSLASGRRTDPETGITYNSNLKVIDTPLHGFSVDLSSNTLIERTIEPASAQDIENTVKVMGGEDWKRWIDFLAEADLLAENFKTITYSYIGPKATERIYRYGTIGSAKAHMEQTARDLDIFLKHKVNGYARSAVCKAAVTRASSVIPVFPLYGAALIKVMTNKGIEELPHAHIYRLLVDMVYGDNPTEDEFQRLRPDAWEMREDVQAEVDALLATLTPQNYESLVDVAQFKQLFLHQNGFGYNTVDYTEDIDLDKLYQKYNHICRFI